MKVIYCFSFGLILFFITFACTSRGVEPSRSSRHTIDTLFQQKIIVLQPEIDSICKVLHKNIYTAAVDSIMSTRNIEMEILVE